MADGNCAGNTSSADVIVKIADTAQQTKRSNDLKKTSLYEVESNTGVVVGNPEEHVTPAANVDNLSQDDGTLMGVNTREKELVEREKELAERELATVRREMSLMRTLRELNVDSREGSINRSSPALWEITDPLHFFDGTDVACEDWIAEVQVLRRTHNLSDDRTRIVISQRLKGKAAEWFYSKQEFLYLPIDDLLEQLKSMFYHYSSKVHIVEEFEKRTWSREESFGDYFHNKVMLANRIKIDEDELIQCLIAGIPDRDLRKQAREQTYANKETLLRAFEQALLPGKSEDPTGQMTQECSASAFKDVTICDRKLLAFMDTRIDICLMRAIKYVEIGAPPLRQNKINFCDIGGKSRQTFGEFTAGVTIDGEAYTINFHVVSDTSVHYDLILGIDPITQKVPEVFNIECICDTQAVSYIVDDDHKSQIAKLIRDYTPKQTREVEISMNIRLIDDEPVYEGALPLPPSEVENVNLHINEWLREGIVQPSSSNYASPVVLVKNKNGSTRLRVNYRRLNRKIVKQHYPLPRVKDLLDDLQCPTVFSTLDLKNNFFRAQIDESSRKYTAFLVPDGQFEFLKAPFDLCNSVDVFRKYINSAFRHAINDGLVLPYVDDLIIPSADYRSGLQKLETVLKIASEYNLTVTWNKCRFLQTRVQYLDHVIENGTVRPSAKKQNAVVNFAEPRTTMQVQRFLELTSYFRHFIPHYSVRAKPLTDLLNTDIVFKDATEKYAFTYLKTAFIDKPVLRLYKVGAKTELHTDASEIGYGAVLLQRDSFDHKLHPIYYVSGKTTTKEKAYTTDEREVFAIIKSLGEFHKYVIGIPFKIVTDCPAFIFTMNKRDLGGHVSSWARILDTFNYTIEHRVAKRLNSVCVHSGIVNWEKWFIARVRKGQNDVEAWKSIRDQLSGKKVDGERVDVSTYALLNGLLFIEHMFHFKLLVPRTMEYQIIHRVHEHSHIEKNSSVMKLLNDYSFESDSYTIIRIKNRVAKICISCIILQNKPSLHTRGPLTHLFVYLLGPLTSTRKDYKHILVVIEKFSRFVWLYALKSTKTSEIVNHLKKQATIFADPLGMIAEDALYSDEFSAYCNEACIKLVINYVPSDKREDRVNRTLLPLLTKLSSRKPENWYKYLGAVQQHFNIGFDEGFSPIKLLLDANPCLQDDPEFRELIEEECIEIKNELSDEQKCAVKDISKLQRQNCLNHKKNTQKYTENDLVAIKRTKLVPQLQFDFNYKYVGPYRIGKILPNKRYVLFKVSQHAGPQQTSAAKEDMKPWLDGITDTSDEE